MYTSSDLGWEYDSFESDETINEDTLISEPKDLSHIELPF
jgi:hypothetical protein